MNAKHIIPFVVTAAAALGLAPAASAANEVQQAASANWSGYVVGGSSSSKSFSSVSGGWTEPTANCSSSSGSSYSAFWVGLGGSEGNQSQDVSTNSGSNKTSLEQAGTEADCSSDGTAQYFAWYELVPAAPVRLGLAVKPGDKMYTRVSVANQQTTVQLTDKTTGQSVTKTLSSPNPDTSSAEWIAEAPSSCDGQGGCQPLPLTDFGNVQFTNAYATANGHTGSISDSDWSAAAVQLSPGASADGMGAVDVSTGGSSAGATPSGLSTDGSSFSVAYSNASSTDTSTGDPYGDGGSGYAYQGGGSGGYTDPGSGSGGYSYPGSGSDGYGDPGSGYAYVYPGGSYSYGYGYPGGYVVGYGD